MVSESKFLYTMMQRPPRHAYLLNAQIKRAKNVGFGGQTDDAKRKQETKIEKCCSGKAWQHLPLAFLGLPPVTIKHLQISNPVNQLTTSKSYNSYLLSYLQPLYGRSVASKKMSVVLTPGFLTEPSFLPLSCLA
jgi:hypothetical protein